MSSPKRGAIFYNLVHNYAAPALLFVLFVVLIVVGINAEWIGLFAASWGFHVAVDRALGFGLKLASFEDTHLGKIGRHQD